MMRTQNKKKIRSFLYLDEYKMYSISSQIFEGLTEYVIDYSGMRKEESEQQKGPIASGKLLADIISKETGSQEKKFLHDYSYNLFEEELSNEKRVLEIDDISINEQIVHLANYDLIKVTGYADLVDLKAMNTVLDKFNELGTALTYVTHLGQLEQFDTSLQDLLSKATDRNEKARIREKARSLKDIKQLAASKGLNMNEDYLSSLKTIFEFGYKGQFQVNIPILTAEPKSVIFSAILNRNLLKETEDIIIQKISRHTEKKLTIFGIITQCKDVSLPNPDYNRDSNDGVDVSAESMAPEAEHLKQAIRNLFPHFASLENTFIGKLPNEVIIDPIAVYREF